MKYERKNRWTLMKFPHVILSTEKCNACSRALSGRSERGGGDRRSIGGRVGQGADNTVADSGG